MRITGNYHLIRLLGRGGFGEVYLGQHVRLNKQAAIKVQRLHLPDEDIEDFQAEAQIIASLDHPHIVRVLDYDVKDGLPFLMMDYAPNGSLRTRHPRGQRLALPLIVSYEQGPHEKSYSGVVHPPVFSVEPSFGLRYS